MIPAREASRGTSIREHLRSQLRNNAYPGYVYGYPHKKAYRTLARPLSPAEVWREEPRHRLFCYVHVPFCTVRCSFCNLFTYVPGHEDPTDAYLDALAQQMAYHARRLPDLSFHRLYLGGGTPTFLSGGQLRRLVGDLRNLLGITPDATHGCIEASPDTLDDEKAHLLRDLGFQRLSLGVQSFVPAELEKVNRRFEFERNRAAIEAVGRARFPHFNIDLIYGLPGQSLATWETSLDVALQTPATSLFLYPLYVRPLTGLDRRADPAPTPTTHQMGAMYDLAVERLTGAGFRQITMRQFRQDETAATQENSGEDLEYRCQHDGMLGLGAGARSYTRSLHYSTPWRMVTRNIRAVVGDFTREWSNGEALIRHGFRLDEDEQRRRFVILSLLHQGVDRRAFQECFSEDVCELFAPQWEALLAEDCIVPTATAIRLTPLGLKHSDVVGQLFFSDSVRNLLETFEYDR